MSLTDSGLRERTWGPYPALRLALEHKDLPLDCYGWSSASDNVFERMPRILNIGLLAKEHRELIGETATKVGWEAIHRELEALARELERFGGLLRSTAHGVDVLHSLERRLPE
jgi:hypothetical protein